MRAVVTGGAGFIGSHLCDALLARGDEVLCVDDLSGPGSTRNIDHLIGHPAFTFRQLDVTSWVSWAERELRGTDVVFHQACTSFPVSMADPERDLLTNGLATLRLLEAVAQNRVPKYVHASTGSVFGEPLAAQDEDHPTRPTSFYGVSKLAGESYVRVMAALHDMDAVVLRYWNVVGPRQDDSDEGGVVPIFIRRALAGEPLIVHGDGEQVRCFTAVADVVAANLLVATPGIGGFYNVGAGSEATISELAQFIRATVRDVPVVHTDPRPGDIRVLRVDNARIRSLGLVFESDWRVVVQRVIDSMAVAA